MQRVGKVLRDSLMQGIKGSVEKNQSIFLLSYTGISALELDGLRKNLRRVGAKMHVAKNRIARLALKELKNETLASTIKGQTAFIWSSADASVVSKALIKFAEKNKNIQIKGGLLDGAYLANTDVLRLSDLPSKEVLQANLLGLLNSPASRLLNALNAKSRDLLSILKQYGEKKGGTEK